MIIGALFFLLLLALGILLSPFILFIVSKWFKVENPSYKKSFIILILTFLIGIVISAVLAILDRIIPSLLIMNILGIILGYAVFYFFFNKYTDRYTWHRHIGHSFLRKYLIKYFFIRFCIIT